MERIIRIGTRKSPLALKQVEEVLEALKQREIFFSYEVVGLETPGDLDKTTFFSEVEGNDFFTRTLDEALLKGIVDCVVHSAKDLPEPIPGGLEIAALMPSLEPSDALVSKANLKLCELFSGARIGVSSFRRKAQIRKFRADLEIRDVRGTIEERLQQWRDGKFDALIVATAALMRLGLEGLISERLAPDLFQPHPLQGRLAILVRQGDSLGGIFAQLDGEAAHV